MPYCQLTLQEREVISQLHFSGLGPTAIGRRLGRSPSTISRELRRNGSGDEYRAVSAQRRAECRRRERPVSRKMDSAAINQAVREKLTQEWSPEQIAGRLKLDHPRDASRRVSHQTIYRWLETCEDREHFMRFLRHGKYRRRHGRETRGGIRNRVSIESRPAVVDRRSRYGDWEGDTMHGAGHSGMIMTCVDRKSGYLLTAKMPDGTSASLNSAKERAFRPVPPKLRRTLTVDNGKEFAGHERLSERLEMPVYFAHAYSSNERATNENTNGLLRQYFPKGTDFRDISHHERAFVTRRLNNRPRKRLNYRTPCEVLTKAGVAPQM
jgi:IS30 family transposase